MIISRTPFRMSFVGGGTDVPSYYKNYTGAVVSTTINKYVYVTINKKFDNGIRIAYSKNEEVNSIAEIEHRLVKATLEHLAINGGIEITTVADIPSKGTGLGSSSSFTVGLLHALRCYLGNKSPKSLLAYDSCNIEMNLCGEPIGKQDQYAAAYGGFNYIEFLPNEAVTIEPIACNDNTLKHIESEIIVFYTGKTRSASTLLRNHIKKIENDKSAIKSLNRMVELARLMRNDLAVNNANSFGQILNENWALKKSLNQEISSIEIDDWYKIGLAAGATGGKILGAGGGGFLMFVAPVERHKFIKKALHFLRKVDINFESSGSKIIFSN